MKKTVQWCAEHKLCCGCGLCVDICSKKAIEIKETWSMPVPAIDKNKCTNCGICFEICSGKGIKLYEKSIKLAKSHILSSNYNEDIGFFTKTYIGHSIDEKIRFHSASGGLVTSLLLYMMDKKIIDGAIVTTFDETDPLKVKTILATERNQIINAKSSKYCPVHMDGIINQLKIFDGKVAFVGLPCQIQTLRNFEEKNKIIAQKVLFHFGIYCSGAKDKGALDYIMNHNGMKKEGLRKFAYRDDGCLGFVKAEYDDKSISVPYESTYNQLRSYFKPERCVFCIDHFAYLSDISFGDIDCKPYNEDKIGSNSVIVRNDRVDLILQEAVNNNYITLSDLQHTEVLRSQRILFFRKQLFKAYRLNQKLLGKKTVTYDKYPDVKLTLKGIVWNFSYRLQRLQSKLGLIK